MIGINCNAQDSPQESNKHKKHPDHHAWLDVLFFFFFAEYFGVPIRKFMIVEQIDINL